MVQLVDGVLMLGFLVVLYLCVQKYNNENCSANSDIIENINLDKLYSSDFAETNNISFDYYPTQEIIDEYQKEQTFGTNTVIKYSNKYADKVDINGNINYNTLQYESGNIDDFNVDSRLIYNDEFYKSNVNYIDGKLDPNDTDNIGKTIKEVYDNSFIDFKKLILNELNYNIAWYWDPTASANRIKSFINTIYGNQYPKKPAEERNPCHSEL